MKRKWDVKLNLDDQEKQGLKKELNRPFVLFGYTLACISLAVPVVATVVSKPHTFEDGGVIYASEINSNFDTVYTEMNAKDLSMTNLPSLGNLTRSCDTGNANDVMVPVGSWCVDKYQAVVCLEDDAGTCLADNSITGLGTDLGANYRAYSKPGAAPMKNISPMGGIVACANAGKVLLTSDIWLTAAMGTPEPANDIEAKADVAAISGVCVLWGAAVRNTNLAASTPANPRDCVSQWGTQDQIGNGWEHTPHAADVENNSGTTGGTNQNLTDPPGGGGSTVPAGVAYGHFWTIIGYGSTAIGGIFARDQDQSITGNYSLATIRCGRPR